MLVPPFPPSSSPERKPVSSAARSRRPAEIGGRLGLATLALVGCGLLAHAADVCIVTYENLAEVDGGQWQRLVDNCRLGSAFADAQIVWQSVHGRTLGAGGGVVGGDQAGVILWQHPDGDITAGVNVKVLDREFFGRWDPRMPPRPLKP